MIFGINATKSAVDIDAIKGIGDKFAITEAKMTMAKGSIYP